MRSSCSTGTGCDNRVGRTGVESEDLRQFRPGLGLRRGSVRGRGRCVLLVAAASNPEQALLQLDNRRKFARRNAPVDPSVQHHRDAVGDRAGNADVLLDQQNLEVSLLSEAREQSFDLLDDHRGEPLRRLVHHEQASVLKQSARDREPLLLAARELAPATVAPLGKAGKVA